MKKLRHLSAVLLLFAASTVCAQNAIERLIPLLAACDSIELDESIYSNFSNLKSTGKSKQYSFFTDGNVPVGKLPAGLKDSLIAAFEHECPLATESDRYQKHVATGDTLSYTLVYNGTTKPAPNSPKLNTRYHSYGGEIDMAASLDIYKGEVNFSYMQKGLPEFREQNVPARTYDAATLAILFNEIAADSRVKTTSVRYDITNGNLHGHWQYHYGKCRDTHTHGTRIEVHPPLADSIYTLMEDAIDAVIYTDQSYVYSRKPNRATSIIFGEVWEGDAFCLRRMEDGRVFILHANSDPDTDVAIPYDWPTTDTISRLKE